MEVRIGDENDVDNVAIVLKESYNIDSIEEGRSVFLSEIKKGNHYIIIKEQSKVVGIVSWIIHDLPKHELAELHRIAVLPNYKGKGYSQELFYKLLDEIKKFYRLRGFRLRKLYLMTHKSNERARGFYEKLGFKYETELKNHYYEGENECVYSMFFK